MKKILSIIVVVCIFSVAFVGCGMDETKFSELKDTTKLSLTFAYGEERNIIEAFKKECPKVGLKITKSNADNYSSKEEYYHAVATEIMAGKSADVVFIDSSLIFNNDIYKMTMADVFVDMSDFIENDPEFNKEDFVMPVIDGAKINGKQYIMPLSYHIPMFFSTEEALAEAGINKQNFNDANGMIDELTGYYKRHTDDKVIPKAFTWSVPCEYMLKYAGVDIIDYAESKIYTDNPLLKNIMDFWKLAYLSEWKNSNTGIISTQSSDLSAQRLDEGTSVMFFDDLGYMRDHINLLHSLKEKGTPVVMPMRNKNSKISVLSYEGVAISASSKNKKNAWEFIKLLMREDLDTQKRTFGMPINKNALENLYSRGLYDYYEEYAGFQEEIDRVYFHSTVDNKLSNIFRKYGRDEADFDSTIKSINELLELYVSE